MAQRILGDILSLWRPVKGIRCRTDALRRLPLRFPRRGGERSTHLAFGQGPQCGRIWCRRLSVGRHLREGHRRHHYCSLRARGAHSQGRALKLWKEYNDTVFKLPRETHGGWLQERHAEVIKRLNTDHFKPWFPAKKDRCVVEDLGDMTYEETILCLVCLMYAAHMKAAGLISPCAT